MAPKLRWVHILGLARETALQLRECIYDISSTTARYASASMAPGNGQMAWLGRNDVKTLLAAAALAITSAVTVQAADIFTCGAIGYAMHDGRVERVCSAPVTTHWTKLGERFSALVNYRDEPDGLHVVVTMQPGERETAAAGRFETVLAEGQ